MLEVLLWAGVFAASIVIGFVAVAAGAAIAIVVFSRIVGSFGLG